MHEKRCRRRSARRQGTATVELALSMPVLLIIVFGAIETCRLIHIRESLHVASYEAGRTSTRPGATYNESVERAQQILRARGLEGATVRITPANVDKLPAGQQIWVTVAAPFSAIPWWRKTLFSPRELSVAATFVKE